MDWTIKGETVEYPIVRKILWNYVTLEFPKGELLQTMFSYIQDEEYLESRMNKRIKVSGIAEWTFKSYEMKSFELTEIHKKYTETPINDAIKGLSEIIGDEFDGIDLNKYIEELRRG